MLRPGAELTSPKKTAQSAPAPATRIRASDVPRRPEIGATSRSHTGKTNLANVSYKFILFNLVLE